MKTIGVKTFCTHYNIPISFIESLSEYELIELEEVDSTTYIQLEDIHQIEKMIRLHYELNVNFEGIDIINHLKAQIKSLEEEITVLKNTIDFYK